MRGGRKPRSILLPVVHPFCEICYENGVIVNTEEVHHKKPLSEGGTHDRDNFIALCKSCHSCIHAQNGRFGPKG